MADIDEIIKALDEKLIQTDDPAQMASIYYDAGLIFSENNEFDEACFFMTQAYILASHLGNKSLTQSTRTFLEDHNRI